MAPWYILLSFSLIFVSDIAFAKTQRLSIEYPSAEWNISPTEVDTAHLYVKRSGQTRFVKVLVSETAPDSSIFSGDFAIQFAEADLTKKSRIEIYVPPTTARGSQESLKQFSRKVKDGTYGRSPTLMRRDRSGALKLDVYDTREQLRTAIEIAKKERLAKQLARQTQQANQASQQDLDRKGDRITDRKNLVQAAATKAAIQAAGRLKQEQLEAQKRTLQKKKMSELSEFRKRKMQDKAEDLVKKGQTAYQAAKFSLAAEYFKKATQLSPEDDRFFFMYGVALYRNEKLNEALVVLKLAKNDKANELERNYYMGLIHYRISEFAPAVDNFQKVKDSKSPALSASASFYKGLSLIGIDKLKEAKDEFEWVLDNSTDPKLDNRAEAQIEKIINLMAYRKRMAQRWALGAKAGLNYDSNILLTSDTTTSTGSATDEGGLRYFIAGNVDYHLVKKDTHQWIGSLDTYYMYSFDDTFTSADPWQTTLGLAYNTNGTNKDKKTYSLSIEPYFETLYMDVEATGTRESILNSFGVNANYTLIRKKTHFVSYGGSVQKDNSSLALSDDEDNADALLYKINTNHTWLLDESKKRSVIGSLELWLNNAEGGNRTYQRLQASGTYVAPMKKWKDSVWTGTFSTYYMPYPDSDSDRKDTNFTLKGTITKPLEDTDWSFTGVGSYIENPSTADDNDYSKYSLMIIANYAWTQ